MSMSSKIVGSRRVQVWQADAEWPDDAFVVPAEDHDEVLVDREVKASNLEKLVDMVLAYADACERCERSGNDGGDVHEAEETWKALLALARGLKQ